MYLSGFMFAFLLPLSNYPFFLIIYYSVSFRFASIIRLNYEFILLFVCSFVYLLLNFNHFICLISLAIMFRNSIIMCNVQFKVTIELRVARIWVRIWVPCCHPSPSPPPPIIQRPTSIIHHILCNYTRVLWNYKLRITVIAI